MKYFLIRSSDEVKEIGEYPQTTIHKSIPHDFYNVKRNELPGFVPKGALEFSKKAIATDYIDGGGIRFGHVISPTFKRILEAFNLPTHTFIPIDVFQDREKLQYFWFHYISSVKEYIDKDLTSLTVFDRFNFEIIQDDIAVSTLGDLGDFQRSLPKDQSLRIKKITLTNEFPMYDVVNIDVTFNIVQLISEKLKRDLEKNKLTGYIAKEYELLQLS